MKIGLPYNKELKFLFKIFDNYQKDSLRVVGGAVRNFLMNKKINDYDLTTTLLPECIIKLLTSYNIKYLEVGKKFGTIIAIINNKQFEITTLRKDIETDGRHANVCFISSYEIDSKRRDLTINALYADKNKNLYDFHNGILDLNKKIIRFIGNADLRVKEDFLRILRFFRFYGDYGTVLDYKSLQACRNNKEFIKTLSKERIHEEFIKILNSYQFYETIFLMNYYGILEEIINIKNAKLHSLETFFYLKPYVNYDCNKLFTLVLLVQENNIENIGELLKLSNKEKQYINTLLKYSTTANIKELFFNLNDKNLVKEIIILYSIINSKDINFINKNIKSINYLKKINFNFSVKDLQEAGYNDNKQFGILLKKARNIFIENNFKINNKKIIKLLKN